MTRFIIMILDGVGAGALPDAAEYGDVGSNTLGNLSALVDMHLPNLAAMGLGNILPLRGTPPSTRPTALPGRLTERSAGKDTTAGHWEHMGVVTREPLPTYPAGFPDEVIAGFEAAIGRPSLGNVVASGTEIIVELGPRHIETGYPIVYTSADSVFQVAAHVDVVPLPELYRWCEAARGLLTGSHAVGRVIARPFEGVPGAFKRTKDRKDFSLEPTGTTYLDLLAEAGVPVVGIGKIHQIFAGRGVSEQLKVASNDDNLSTLLQVLDRREDALIFTNLVDFDMVWGHRNDVEGFAAGLEAVDRGLADILARLGPDDRLLITADHGVDPTTVSTDHSREYVPLLYYPRPPDQPSAVYQGFMSDTGATAYLHLTGRRPPLGGTPIQDGRPALGWGPYPWGPASPADAEGGRVSADRDRVGTTDAVAAAGADFLRQRFGEPPQVAVVLGSGLDAVAEAATGLVEVGYGDIPGWVTGAVAGHSGRLAVGVLAGVRACLLRGRVHAYEGFDPGVVQLQVRTMAAWGVPAVILTNASGGLDDRLSPGQVAVVDRILDLQSPPSGPDPRTVAGTDAAAAALLAQSGLGLSLLSYAALPGPQYETAAEVAVLKSLGAQAVGMSTVQEARAAHALGMSVAVLSVVTNMAGESGADGAAVHQEVVQASSGAAERVTQALEVLLGAGARGWLR